MHTNNSFDNVNICKMFGTSIFVGSVTGGSIYGGLLLVGASSPLAAVCAIFASCITGISSGLGYVAYHERTDNYSPV